MFQFKSDVFFILTLRVTIYPGYICMVYFSLPEKLLHIITSASKRLSMLYTYVNCFFWTINFNLIFVTQLQYIFPIESLYYPILHSEKIIT